ncbi:ROK family transcriptional regulator [Arthrobacter globiformis]|uniref:ROK family transcriptional regulator n=1 Tax=Arthrobacter globiformis TaxID=1665 RepID=UPI000B413013|nr:ROK family transcriptional regulator [Arthrobacter globiformis]
MTVVQTLPAEDSQSRTKKAAPGFGASELFQILRDGRPRTRSELAAATGFARSTITARVEELLQTGFIAPVGDAASTGGRPPARVAFNPSARVVAAGDIGATHATVAIMDLAGTTLAKTREQIQISDGPESVLDWLTDTVSSLLSTLQRTTEDLIAVGIGLPGPVEHSTGKPSQPPIMPGWDGFDVPNYVQRSFDVAVLVDNDVNIMALGERAVSWPETDNMLFLKVATGIGSGIISSGQLQRGENGTAGDVGHIAVNRAAGIACRCGNIGCLEAIAGRPAVARALRSAGVEVPNDSDVIALVRHGNILASQIIRQAGRDIGEVLNMCVSLLNPAVIVIGGSMAEAGEQLIAGIREVVYARSTPLATQDLSIVPARTGADAGITGAAIMALDHILAPENLEMLAASQ